MSTATVTREPARLRTLGNKQMKAAELSQLTDGEVIVRFAPSDVWDHDSKAQGHLYQCRVADPDFAIIILDDRGPGSLQSQLADELRRVASEFERLAGMAEE